MRIVYDEKTEMVSVHGLSAGQIMFLDVILIKVAFAAKSQELREKADELQEITGAGWKMIMQESEAANEHHL